MKTIRKIVSYPFIVIGLLILFVGCILLGGPERTLVIFKGMKSGIANAKKNS